MAEYTRDIQQLQKTASQQPQFAPPSQSLAGDVVNLIGTGLDFYAKGQAQDKLEAISQKKAEYTKEFSKGVLGLREYEQELEANNVSGNTYNTKINQYMKQFPPEMRLEIFGAKNKLTGKSSSAVASGLDKKQEDFNKQQEAIKFEGSSFAAQVLKINPNDISTASPEQLKVWADKSKVMGRQIEIQKQIIEVSDDVTAPIIEIARTITSIDIQSQLDNIRDLQKTGDVEGYTNAGKALRTNIMQMVNNAPTQIKQMMPAGKEGFYDAKLVSVYTKELADMLENPTVKNALSGQETNESMANSAEIVINSRLTPYFLELSNKISSGDMSPQVMDDYKNIVEWTTSRNISGISFSGTMENTILRSMGKKPLATTKVDTEDPKQVKEQEKNQSQSNIEVLFEFANNPIQFVKNLGKSEVEVLNNQNKEYILDKLENDKELSDTDIVGIESLLTYGNTGNTEQKGMGASKAVLQAPIAILAHENYSKIKPAIDRATANGIDVVGALTSSLDNHIRNNVSNAFTNIMGVATSGMMGGPKTGISNAGERGPQAVGMYNLRDIVGLHNDNGKLVFKYKAGTLGQSTDSNKIQNLRKLNNTLVVLNDYVKAMSNVTGTEGSLVADEIRGLLGKYVNIPLPEDKPN